MVKAEKQDQEKYVGIYRDGEMLCDPCFTVEWPKKWGPEISQAQLHSIAVKCSSCGAIVRFLTKQENWQMPSCRKEYCGGYRCAPEIHALL
jgi:RNase P subunit RPR2